MKNNIRVSVHAFILLVVFGAVPAGCKKLVQVDAPYTNVNAANVYTTDATSTAVLTGLYDKISSNATTIPGLNSLSFFGGMSADELTLYNTGISSMYTGYYLNALKSSIAGGEVWNNTYPLIFITNSAIQGLQGSNSLTPAVQQQLRGEAKFIRALCYFYLVSLYGDVPLVLTTNYTTNALLSRTPKADVWKQIILDLQDAQSLLNTNFVDATLINSSTERTRPTKWAAMALLARAYLYTGDYVDAESQATAVINNTSAFTLTSLDGVFLKNSKEAIWQLQPVNTSVNTGDGRLFILPTSGPSSANPVFLSNSLWNAFETGDNRQTHWVNSITVSGVTYYYPFKYKVTLASAAVSEYQMVLRLGEQYLIRAEARTQQGHVPDGLADLNVIRARAGLAGSTASTQSAVLSAIQHERQIELFTEWGHRWLDLKRTGNIDIVMGTVLPQKGGASWSTNWQLYPVPLTDLSKDPNLIQNTGY